MGSSTGMLPCNSCMLPFLQNGLWNNLSMKEGSLICFVLFCSYEIHRTRMLQIVFLVGFSTRRGAWAWFHDVWTCCAKVLEYWMISLLKLNQIVAENFGGIWMCLWFCWKDLDEQEFICLPSLREIHNTWEFALVEFPAT
jgi:hypothetical protein